MPYILILLLLIATPASANYNFSGASITTSGSSDDAFVVPKTNFIGDWTACPQLVAYYSMNETGTNDRESTSGTCTDDCDLTASGTMTSSGDSLTCRSGGASTQTGTLSCFDSTCDEIDFNSEDFSITGFFKANIAITDECTLLSKESGSSGYELQAFYINDSSHDVRFTVESNNITINNVAHHLSWQFIGASWDESADDMDLCVGGPDSIPTQSGSFWTCSSNNSVTGPVSSTSVDFYMFGGTASCYGGQVDDLAFWNIKLTESEKCYICACRPTGDDCGIHKGVIKSSRFRRWKDYCGGCTLPNTVPTCPTGE